MINNLRKIVEKSDTKLGLIFDLSIQALIIASIVIFSLETLPDLDPVSYTHLTLPTTPYV